MQKAHIPISLILRLTLGATFILNGIYKLNLSDVPTFQLGYKLTVAQESLSALFGLAANAEFVFWSSTIGILIGFLLVFGVFTRFFAALVIAITSLQIVGGPVFFENPFWGILQNSQLVMQIFLATAIFYTGSQNLSFDNFFFPLKVRKVNIEKLSNILSKGLAISFVLTFISIFLYIDETNYVIFHQWHYLGKVTAIFNMPFIAGFLAVSAILLFLNYSHIAVGFVGSLIFLISMLLMQVGNFELLPLFGACLALTFLPKKALKARKVIPKRKLKDL